MQIFTIGWNPAIDRILRCCEFRPGTHQKVQLVARLAAGKAANVSRALALLGINSIAAGIMGRDEAAFFSQQLEALEPGKVQCRWVLTDQHTRENITVLSDRAPRDTHLSEEGFHLTDAYIAALENQLTSQIRSGDVAVFAGSLPAGLSAARYASILDQLLQSGVLVAVDTSGEALREALKRPLWAVKPNLEELSEALGQTIANDPLAIIAALKSEDIHPENILVSRESAGAVLFSRTGCWSGNLQMSGPIISTVGCGDYLLAGFVAGAIGDLGGPKLLSTALALASLRALSPDPAAFDVGQIGRLSELAQVTPL
ncbi:MAG TPA: hexose kinase [Phycisphaerae bacterium]|nr:hexose kinase [Phycisphaerae bacterium]